MGGVGRGILKSRTLRCMHAAVTVMAMAVNFGSVLLSLKRWQTSSPGVSNGWKRFFTLTETCSKCQTQRGGGLWPSCCDILSCVVMCYV